MRLFSLPRGLLSTDCVAQQNPGVRVNRWLQQKRDVITREICSPLIVVQKFATKSNNAMNLRLLFEEIVGPLITSMLGAKKRLFKVSEEQALLHMSH